MHDKAVNPMFHSSKSYPAPDHYLGATAIDRPSDGSCLEHPAGTPLQVTGVICFAYKDKNNPLSTFIW